MRTKLFARRVIADKYVLDRALAAGGMGSVWSAWNTQLDIPVAIKFMAPALAGSPDLVARFEREARAAAQLRSVHVVQIFEHGLDGGQPFIVMELLEGEDVGARMRREGRLSLAETARIVDGVCRALRRAHALGIVHRDLKPANVFLARADEEDDEDVVKVLDFGVVKSLAEAVESGVTKTGEIIGTPHYMSPEQARSTRSVDHRSDLWSLGIIAYRALTASLPFPDDDGIGMLLRACSEHAPPPSSFARELGPDVDAFFERALALDPEDRFQTAREMADAMCQLAGLPVPSQSSGRHPAPSVLTNGPGSSSLYPSLAYVYSSAASSSERLLATGPTQAWSALPSLREAALRDVASQEAETRGSQPPDEDEIEVDITEEIERARRAEDTTRVSAQDGPPPARASSGSVRPAPIAIVTRGPARAGDAGPPDVSIDVERSTLTHAGVERDGQPSAAPIDLTRPRVALLAAIAALVLTAFALAFTPLAGSQDARATPPAPGGRLSWTNAIGADLASPSPDLAAPTAPAHDAATPAPAPTPLDAAARPIRKAPPPAPSVRPGPRRGHPGIRPNR